MDVNELTNEDIALLKRYFIESKLIKFSDLLAPIDEFFFKLDLNNETQNFELYMGVPKDWVHDMIMDNYKIELVTESDGGKIIKLVIDSDEYSAQLDDLVAFAIDITQRNNAILAKIREKESELAKMKALMIEKQLELSSEIEKLKKINTNEESEEEEVSEGTTEGITEGTSEEEKIKPLKTTVTDTVKPTIYIPPKQSVPRIKIVEEKKNKITNDDVDKLEDLIHGTNAR
jgi:hypothetical protein